MSNENSDFLEEEFIECSGPHTALMKSPYPKNHVPKELFMKDTTKPNSKMYKRCFHCRDYKTQTDAKRKKKREEEMKISEEEGFKMCQGKHIPAVNSPYPKGKVPEYLFRKNPEDPESKLYKTCIDCRKFEKNYKNKVNNKIKETGKEHKKILKDGETEYGYCFSVIHSPHISEHPRDRIPLDEIRKIPGNPNSELYEQCLSCRNKYSSQSNSFRNKIRKDALDRGVSLCQSCNKELNEENFSYNTDGSVSTKCINCKEYSIEKRRNLSEIRRDIIIEFIEKNECSCYKCKRIFLKPIGNNLKIQSFETFLGNDNKRRVIENAEEYLVKDFIESKRNLLETDIIDLDHLTEAEQIERGIIDDDESFIPKVKPVSLLSSEHSMRTEALKTQPLCVRCHMEETIRRQKEYPVKRKQGKTGGRKIKSEYVNSLKLKGCESCGYQNEKLLKFFDMDHLNIENKIANISVMIHYSNYSLEDVIEECEKCRVLCRECHRIHTRIQRELGIIKFGKITYKNQGNDSNNDSNDKIKE